jgi:3-oxoacyl-[acyl-carrier protein] reductase
VNLGLSGRTAIVVASSQGIGRATAETLAAEGANVVLCARGAEELDRAATEIAEAHGADRVLAVPADVRSGADIEALVAKATAAFGGVDILVASTGGPPPTPFMEVTDEEWSATFDSILLSAARLVRAVVPSMREGGWGRILFVTSTAAKQPLAHLVLSNATRPGVHGLAKTLSQELGEDGITVNCVCPGIVKGTRAEQIFSYRSERQGVTTEAVQAEIRETIPLNRVGTAQDLASAIAFLASEPASYITGTSLSVDGGLCKSTF